MKLGKLLEYWMNETKISAYRLAQESTVSASYIKNILDNRGTENEPNVSVDVIERLCNALGISIVDFFNADNSNINLTDLENEAIEIMRRLSPQEREGFIAIMKVVADNKK